MKGTRLFALLSLLTVAFFMLPASLSAQTDAKESGTIIKLNAETFRLKVYDYKSGAEWKYRGDIPCIVDFYADWCGPCRQLKPTLERLAKEYKGKIYIYAVDVDANRELAEAFKVRSIPMTLVIPMNGKPLMNTGNLPYDTFKKQIEDVLNKK
ncbi:MAG: thioredoxin domain-containing protein [Porphyromonas sp.]|nr:thioredoxin domain-containing protein [Porphyromonas sp.]